MRVVILEGRAPMRAVRALPDVSAERVSGGGWSYPATGQASAQLFFRMVKASGGTDTLTFEMDRAATPTEAPIASFLARVSRVDALSPIVVRTELTDRAPLAPGVRVTCSDRPQSGVVLARLSATFTGMWPKSGEYSIAYDSQLRERIRQLLEPYGEILSPSTVVKATADHWNAVLAESVNVTVKAGGEVARRFIEGSILDDLLRTMFEPIGTSVRLRLAVDPITRRQSIDMREETPFTRAVDLA